MCVCVGLQRHVHTIFFFLELPILHEFVKLVGQVSYNCVMLEVKQEDSVI